MDIERKNIAIIVPSLSNGGAERVVSNLSIELSHFYCLKIIVFDNSEQSYPVKGEIIDLHLPSKKGFLRKFVTLYKRIKKVKCIKRKYRFDCSISFMSGPSYVNVQSSVGEKTIVSVRNNMTLSDISRFERFMLTKSCKKASKVVSLSETVKEDLIQNFGISRDSITTIYNSVDGERLLKMSKQTDIDSALLETKYIVNVGRITKQKGQWHLIKAFSVLSKKHPDIRLVILGQGEDAYVARIKSLVSMLGLDDKILFLGYVRNPHVIVANSMLFVFSSLFEGLGNSILEALSCGKAVVSTDCIAGPREILSPTSDFSISITNSLKTIEFAEFGVLTPSFEQEDFDDSTDLIEKERLLAYAIDTLIENADLLNQYESKALKRASDFSPNIIAEEWISLINDITK